MLRWCLCGQVSEREGCSLTHPEAHVHPVCRRIDHRNHEFHNFVTGPHLGLLLAKVETRSLKRETIDARCLISLAQGPANKSHSRSPVRLVRPFTDRLDCLDGGFENVAGYRFKRLGWKTDPLFLANRRPGGRGPEVRYKLCRDMLDQRRYRPCAGKSPCMLLSTFMYQNQICVRYDAGQ